MVVRSSVHTHASSPLVCRQAGDRSRNVRPHRQAAEASPCGPPALARLLRCQTGIGVDLVGRALSAGRRETACSVIALSTSLSSAGLERLGRDPAAVTRGGEFRAPGCRDCDPSGKSCRDLRLQSRNCDGPAQLPFATYTFDRPINPGVKRTLEVDALVDETDWVLAEIEKRRGSYLQVPHSRPCRPSSPRGKSPQQAVENLRSQSARPRARG
jgi:hypothetical protein